MDRLQSLALCFLYAVVIVCALATGICMTESSAQAGPTENKYIPCTNFPTCNAGCILNVTGTYNSPSCKFGGGTSCQCLF